MGDLERDGQELSAGPQYRTLLAISEAIVSHRDLATLFHDLAGRLHRVVRFDYLACVLHEATSNTMRLHILETTEPIPAQAPRTFSVEEDPAGIVLQTQQPLIVSNVAGESRWPQFPERAKPFGVNSLCYLPLTTARRRLGVLVFAGKQAGAYDMADLDFLQQVANQVAGAVENALAFAWAVSEGVGDAGGKRDYRPGNCSRLAVTGSCFPPLWETAGSKAILQRSDTS